MKGHTHKTKHIKKKIVFNELHYSTENELYGTINCDLGNATFEVTIHNTNKIIQAKACGAIIKGPKKQRLNKGDMILVQLDTSTTSKEKYFIIHKYSPDDVKNLRLQGHLTQIKEICDKNKPIVTFENDVIQNVENDIDIDDDFIAGI
jgi:translation initiation factor IF-1